MYRLVLTLDPYLPRAMAFLGLAIAISAFLYGFLLLEAVGHTAARSQAERHIRELSSELGVLQADYLSQTRQVTLELAVQMGFVAPTETSLVFATPRSALSLSSVNAGQ